MELLEVCDRCEGNGERWNYYQKSKKLEKCDTCNGKGKLVLGGEWLKYKIALLNREIPYYWKIIKHEKDFPYMFDYGMEKQCDACNGEGEWEERISNKEYRTVTCKVCEGYGHIYPKKKELYNKIFDRFVSSKQRKEDYVKLLEDRVFEREEYKGFEQKKVPSYWWVCVKCIRNFDGSDGMGGADSCCGCVNESMTNANGYSYFKPINEKAKEWYNNGGYKKNLCYDPKHNYKVK